MRWVMVAAFSVLVVGRTYFKLRHNALWDSYKGREPRALIMYRTALGAALAVAVTLYVFNWDWRWMSHPLPGVLRGLGMVFLWGGVALIFWAHHCLGENFSPSVGKAVRLVKAGPYRRVRHPMYVGYVALFAGVWLVTGQWVIGLLGQAVMLSLVLLRLPIEEALLDQRFGDEYREYASRTPRFVPSRGRRRQSPDEEQARVRI